MTHTIHGWPVSDHVYALNMPPDATGRAESDGMPPVNATEHEEQKRLFSRVDGVLAVYPILRWVFAVPNGGYRHPATAGKMKSEGQKAGVPDILFPVPLGAHIGLAIEMKVGRNKPTKKQEAWLDMLHECGWSVHVCYGADEAWSVLMDYLAGE